jgi:hypothetical protein
MSSLQKLACFAVVTLGFAVVSLHAQNSASSSAAAPAVGTPAPTVDLPFIHKQFGEEFSLAEVSQPYIRDIDGDGVDDLVIVARSKKPMIEAAEHNYRVIDPYYTFYGYGDPKLTATFGSEDPTERNLVILVIHGAGPEAWRAEVPKAKYVIINLPLKRIAVKKLQLRKRQVNAIFAVEADASAGDSVVFWDGKQYKYQPIGTNSVD